MRRTVRATLTILSLLACLAVACLWWRGRETTDCIDYTHTTEHRDTITSLYSWRGSFVLEIRREPPARWNRRYRGLASRSFPSAHVWTAEHLKDLRRHASWTVGIGVGYAPFVDDSGSGAAVAATSWTFWVPPVYPLILLAMSPALWIYRFIRQRRRVAFGRCAHCGYDLRASADRCPECGQPVTVGAPKAT